MNCKKYSIKEFPSSTSNEIVSSSECSYQVDEDRCEPLGKVILDSAWREGSMDFRMMEIYFLIAKR